MIADDRGSQIADDRKESCFHMIVDDRKRSQSRLLHTFRTAEVSKFNTRKKSQQTKCMRVISLALAVLQCFDIEMTEHNVIETFYYHALTIDRN